VKELIEAVAIEGTGLKVVLSPTLPIELPTLAVATAIRALDRYPFLDRVAVLSGATEITLARGEVEQLLQPDGVTAARESDRWPQVLARAVEGFLAR
jgi:hypothetical protein